MLRFELEIRTRQVEELLDDFQGTVLDAGQPVSVTDLRVERHFDLSEVLLQLSITAPVSVATSVLAAQISEFLKARLHKTRQIKVGDTPVDLSAGEIPPSAIERGLRRTDDGLK
ncbi:MAG: hypothetical protein ABW022_12755 [Actinoplanes sp.]